MSRNALLLIVTSALVVLGPGAAALAVPPDYPATPREIREYRDSGRWDRDIKAVTDRARNRLKKRMAGRDAPRRPALVLDVDETSLDNYPCLDEAGLTDPDGALAGCVVRFDSRAVEQVRSVFRLARRLDVTVFFITGRPDAIRDGTLRDLRDSGYTGRLRLVMRPDDYDRESVVPYKSGARREIQRRGFRILANLGDQRSDLRGGHSERRYYVPNPMYFAE